MAEGRRGRSRETDSADDNPHTEGQSRVRASRDEKEKENRRSRSTDQDNKTNIEEGQITDDEIRDREKSRENHKPNGDEKSREKNHRSSDQFHIRENEKRYSRRDDERYSRRDDERYSRRDQERHRDRIEYDERRNHDNRERYRERDRHGDERDRHSDRNRERERGDRDRVTEKDTTRLSSKNITENPSKTRKNEEDVKKKSVTENGDDVKPLGRSGGVYVPPAKLAQMMKSIEDKSGLEYQRMSWDALKKSINGLVNKVNASNIKNIVPELISENLIRGRGLFCRSCMKSQMASPTFTDVFAAIVAVVNTKFPEVGNLLLKRIILQLRRAFRRNDKPVLLAATKFIAHLVNQQVAHEIIALELLTLLLENPTDDSVEVAVGFVKECGKTLQQVSPQGLFGIFERFRAILHEGEIDKRVQFLIEGLFAIRKANFQGFPAVRPELDLVEQEDQFTHELSLEDEYDQEVSLDIFKPDPNFLENEKAYEDIRRDILGEESSSDDEKDDDEDEEEDDDDEEEDEDEQEERLRIRDETETNLVNLRRTIYLTIMSSVDFEEAGHKLLKIKLEPGQEMELCTMLLECCSQERTYLRYYGLLGQRFCMINKVYQENFDKCFVQQYSMIHRLETNKLRNVAKFFAHLLGTDALPWHCLAYIRLTEEDTTSSSRIFIKILFQELAEQLGIRLLNERLNDPTMVDSFESIFPKDNPKNSRFAINFFTSIGLGGITESLREYLKNMPRLIMQQQRPALDSDDSSSSDGSSDSGSSSSEGLSSESSDSESEGSPKRKRRQRQDSSDSDSGSHKRRKKRTSTSESDSESDSDRKRRRKR